MPPRVAAGERVELTARYRPRDGSTHWTRLVCAPYRPEADGPWAILVAARQIDNEVAAQEALQESHRRRDRLIKQLPVGVFRACVGADGVPRFDFASPRTAELLRQPADVPLEVASLVGLIEPSDLAELYTLGAAAAAGSGTLVWEGRLTGPGPVAWLIVRANVERAADGELLIDGTVADETQAKAFEEHLAAEADTATRRTDLLAEIDRTRSALLAALGHDLRTPLAVVASSASGLRLGRNLTPGEREELLTNIEDGTDALAHLLTDLLDLSRVEAGALPVQLGAVDLVEVLEEPLRRTAAGVELDIPDDLPEVVADAGLLERVLDNLLRNADRHRPAGTAITVAARVVADRVLVSVVDQGPGVPPERYAEIFAPFQRLDDRATGGIGLGLSIARSFTDAMGGFLTPSQTPGGGLTMTVDLPAAREPQHEDPGYRPRHLWVD